MTLAEEFERLIEKKERLWALEHPTRLEKTAINRVLPEVGAFIHHNDLYGLVLAALKGEAALSPPTGDVVEAIAAKLLSTVNAPEQEIYRIAREIAALTRAEDKS